MTELFPTVELSGLPYERGRQYGEQAAERIRFNLEGYWRLFRHDAGLGREEVLARIPAYVGPIQGYAPDLLAEMRGIADGAGVSLEEVLALNCRTEILSVGKIRGECTAVFCAPQATAGGRVLLAQNWDWSHMLRGGMVLLRVVQPGRPTVLTLTEAGMVGKIGLNSAGIGVCTNFLRHNGRRAGVPFHLILREMLNAPRPGLAVNAVNRGPRADAGNYLVAHRDGEALCMEATPADVGVLYPRHGVLVHTNHYLTARLQAGDTGMLESDNTLWRYGRAWNLLRRELGRITVGTLQVLFQDHFDHPRSICRHPDPEQPEPEQTATLASMILDLTAGQMHIAAGEPCRTAYYTVEP